MLQIHTGQCVSGACSVRSSAGVGKKITATPFSSTHQPNAQLQTDRTIPNKRSCSCQSVLSPIFGTILPLLRLLRTCCRPQLLWLSVWNCILQESCSIRFCSQFCGLLEPPSAFLSPLIYVLWSVTTRASRDSTQLGCAGSGTTTAEPPTQQIKKLS